jgi:hypothetical protein
VIVSDLSVFGHYGEWAFIILVAEYRLWPLIGAYITTTNSRQNNKMMKINNSQVRMNEKSKDDDDSHFLKLIGGGFDFPLVDLIVGEVDESQEGEALPAVDEEVEGGVGEEVGGEVDVGGVGDELEEV